MLREYQQAAHDQTIDHLCNGEGNLCLQMPTGSGKSHVIAALTKTVCNQWKGSRVLMLTHVKELIEQNYEKLKQHWPNAPAGIYSASMGRKELDMPITYAGIQSIHKHADKLDLIDLVMIDECHLINHKDEGSYRTLLNQLKKINPYLKIVGTTATPWRLGHGLITEGDALFDKLIEPVTIEELISQGYLAPLRSKNTGHHLNVDGVKKRGGEYIESQLQAAVNTDDNNIKIIEETISRAGDRKAWLFFCSGVEHAKVMADLLNEHGIKTACLTGKHTKKQRESLLNAFKGGVFQAVTNANILTTGFDYPDIDLIVFARPTMSPSLYVQMAGRGMRLKSHTDHCMVLDFAGNVRKHGPIIAVSSPKPKGKGGKVVMKDCPVCYELVYNFVSVCPCCGYEFSKKEVRLYDDDIMGIQTDIVNISDWKWSRHISRSSGNEMIKCTYYGALNDYPVTEYFAITNQGQGGDIAVRKLAHVAHKAGAIEALKKDTIQSMAEYLNLPEHKPPTEIEVKRDGKFKKIIGKRWG
jgi:DNA repair protein RadD